MTRRSRLWVSRSQVGTSLVELTVAIAIMALLGGAAFEAIASSQTQTTITSERFSAENAGQVIMDRLAKDLRTAVPLTPTSAPFITADANHAVFYANLGNPNGPTKLDVFLVADDGSYDVHEDSTQADAGSAPNWTYTGPAVTRIDGRYVDDSTPIFTYYDAAGAVLPAPVSDLVDIESVGILLTTRVTPTGPPTTLLVRVHLRNVDYNPQDS